jgi:hypothetical protein
MAVTINASTSAGLVMTSDLSGVLTLQQNGVSLPNGGVAPAFSAYLSANQSVTTSTWTKIAYDTEVFDTNNNFASNRFTPTVAGYYQINAIVRINSGATSTLAGIAVYKNGSQYAISLTSLSTGTFGVAAQVISELVYCNGSTDYIEIYGYNTSGTSPVFDGSSGSQYTRVSGSLVRGA